MKLPYPVGMASNPTFARGPVTRRKVVKNLRKSMLHELVSNGRLVPFVREKVFDTLEAGISRRVVGVEFFGEPLEQGVFTQFWPVTKNEKIGDITVALHSPRLQKNIGYAMVDVEYAVPGTSLMVESSLGKLEAIVVEMPFVKSIRA